jgi:ribosome maturation factor RimP
MNLEEQIAKIIQANGAEFYDTETATEADQTVYRVFITHPDGVTLDLCATLSHELSPFLDVHPPMSGKYFLEVSSPGIERKLTKPRHFQQAIGERVKLKVPGQDRLKGTIVSADDKGVIVETKHGEETYSYGEIMKAKTYFQW